MPNPVRIYVLHHPKSTLAEQLTDHIYDWFRMPTLEGIPVYVRSHTLPDQRMPLEPQGKDESLEYLVPLVDAHMVRDAAWHDYLLRLAGKCIKPSQADTIGWVMFPVALDSTAFNLPHSITRLNFVRYVTPTSNVESDPTAQLLKDLTEAFSRDLNARIFPDQIGRRLKVFISYARADGSEIPKAIREYIQGQTQCEAFFDENDIGFGFEYEGVLDKNLVSDSRALIVVNGDHYADRPVCRWEIRRFTQPTDVALSGKRGEHKLKLFHPVVALNTMRGDSFTRVVPELGQIPMLRWQPGKEITAFSLLLRHVLMGTRNVLAARQIATKLKDGIVVNRLPGPVALQRLINEHTRANKNVKTPLSIHYPGNGLPLMELQLLETTFEKAKLTAFRDIDKDIPDLLKTKNKSNAHAFQGRVLNISFGNSDELSSLGYLSQHMDEAIIHLLRPLLRHGADIMYGGNPPKEADLSNPHSKNVNLKLMQLVKDELSISMSDGGQDTSPKSIHLPRLFNPVAWPNTEEITPQDEAAWINSCTITRVTPELAKLKGNPPQKDTPLYYAWRARSLSFSRELMAAGFQCDVPGNPNRQVSPMATVFLGGRMDGFSGCMPGILEEFYFVAKYERPTFILGGFGGTTKLIAQALLGKTKQRAPEFTTNHYVDPKHPKFAEQLRGMAELSLEPEEQTQHRLNWLWEYFVTARKQGLAKTCRNGLSDTDNKELMTTTDSLRAVHLVWKGLAQMISNEKNAY